MDCVALHAPLSMGLSRQEYRSGLPFTPPRDPSDPGMEPESPASPALAVDSLPLSHQGSLSKPLTLISPVSFYFSYNVYWKICNEPWILLPVAGSSGHQQTPGEKTQEAVLGCRRQEGRRSHRMREGETQGSSWGAAKRRRGWWCVCSQKSTYHWIHLQQTHHYMKAKTRTTVTSSINEKQALVSREPRSTGTRPTSQPVFIPSAACLVPLPSHLQRGPERKPLCLQVPPFQPSSAPAFQEAPVAEAATRPTFNSEAEGRQDWQRLGVPLAGLRASHSKRNGHGGCRKEQWCRSGFSV